MLRAGRSADAADAVGVRRRAGAAAASHALVRAREEVIGRAIATRVIEKPRLTAWMILVPVLLVDYVFRCRTYQAGVEAFARECMRERRLALDAALVALERGVGRADALAALGLDDSPAPDDASAVRRAQRDEIDLLFDHYLTLLRSEGDGYEALLRRAYGNGARYAQFLERLRLAERETGRAVRRSLGDGEELPRLLARTAAVVEAVRAEEAARVFPELTR